MHMQNGQADRGTGEPARQAMRRIDVNPLLMTPTHGTFHHPLVTILTRLYPFPLAPAPVLVVRLIGHVDFAMLLWERGQRGRERAERAKGKPEYCKIQYLGNDACADSCVQNVTGNAIRSDPIRCDAMWCPWEMQKTAQVALRLAITTIFQLHN